MNKNLIFDIGLHKGHDAFWYLQKGFQVVGVEAVPELATAAASAVAGQGGPDKFFLVQKALAERAGETVSFFMTPEIDTWGSLSREMAEKGQTSSIEISVPTTTLAELIKEFGVPYYIKCDIEGGDTIFVQQLLGEKQKPQFVSVELSTGDDLERLSAAGYKRFQLVNQANNYLRAPPNPPLEGQYASAYFTHEMSGLFGLELPDNAWRSLEDTKSVLAAWAAMQAKAPEIAYGWIDCHARLD